MPLVTTRAGAGSFGLGWGAAAGEEELGGMVLLKPTSIAYTGTSASIGANGSVEFTAVSSLSLNGVFSADYDNYMIVSYMASPNTGGVDKAVSLDFPPYGSSTFTVQYLAANSTAVTASRATGRSSFTAARINDSGLYSGNISFLYGPYLAQPTAHRLVDSSTAGSAAIWDRAATESSSTQHQNCRVFSDVDFSGLVSVYGLVGA